MTKPVNETVVAAMNQAMKLCHENGYAMLAVAVSLSGLPVVAAPSNSDGHKIAEMFRKAADMLERSEDAGSILRRDATRVC